MKCAVISIVISLIINEICLADGDIGNQLAITDGPSSIIQSCVAKVIEHILNPSESLAFVITSHPDYIPISRLSNPVTVVDVRKALPTHYKMYEVNYVIEAESLGLLAETLYTIGTSTLWHDKESPKGKLVILIKEEAALKPIFFRMWRYILALHIIVIIYEDTSKNCPIKVITGNPHVEGNKCGRKPTVFSNFSCDNLSLEFLKPIRNYNGCPVFIKPQTTLFRLDLNEKGGRIMYNLLTSLKRALNVTPVFLFGEGERTTSEVYEGNEILMIQRYFGQRNDFENSVIFSRKLFLWMGPRPTRISPLNTVFLPFKCDLWLAVLFITILIVLVKWMIIKGNGYNNNYVNIACAFTDIIGLTFGVCVNRIPNIWSLKLLMGFFLVYMIHIHTAYTSDLINILTVPRYEGRILNVEEVAVSGLPIFMSDIDALQYFKNVTDGGSLLGKINKLMIPYKYLRSTKAPKYFLVNDEDDVLIKNSDSRTNSRYLSKTKFNAFLTSDISGEIKEVLILDNGSYFAESLNAVITHLWESGTHEVDAKLNPSRYKVRIKESDSKTASASASDTFSEDVIVRPLRLKDLLPIFVIFLIFLSFCIIIFVAEIFVHKIVSQHSNQVVHVNV